MDNAHQDSTNPATPNSVDASSNEIPEFLRSLNPQQRAAAMHGRMPLLIVAGAGTGKTTTLAHRVAWQIVSGTPPSRILLLTFTRRAAAEMLKRVESIVLQASDADQQQQSADSRKALSDSLRRMRGGTFHAVANGLLRRYGQMIGLHPDFTILDRGDSEDLIHLVRTRLGLAKSETRFPLKATCQDIYSRCVNTQEPLSDVLEKNFPWCREHEHALAALFDGYIEQKEKQRVLDYDDLLLFWKALVEDEAGGRVIREQFDCVLVDEYQDTNVLQADILKALCPDGTGLTAVGDDAQSIYSFRAATVRNILDFPDQYPGTTLVPLEQNYRSTHRILEATNRVIEQAAERHRKELWSDRGPGEKPVIASCLDEAKQTEYLVDRILERREEGVRLQQQSVLFRASHHSLALELELGRRNIPFQKYGGLRFIETAHVKDLMAFLRWSENPLDSVAITRVLMLLPGIGHRRAMVLNEKLEAASGDLEALDQWTPPSQLADTWTDLVALLNRLQQPSQAQTKNGLPADIHAIRSFYTPLMEAKYDNIRARKNDLMQLEAISARYRTRRDFLTEMTLDPPSSTQELPADPWLDDDFLVLSTIHSAKGLEWDTVFVIHASDGNIPADMATGSPEEIEEERRLFYVALTRAKNRLFVVRPERYYFHNRHRSDLNSLSRITRFLPPGVQKLFALEFCGTMPDDTRPSYGANASDTRAVRDVVRRLWSSNDDSAADS